MKKERKPVSYRDLSFRTIREKRYSHLFLLLGWVGYFLLYTLTENLIPAENCHVIHCALDDVIPFCEGFLIFYVSWYALIVLSLLYFLRWDVDSFKKLQVFIMITQAVAMLIYILWPSRQDLRPEVMPRENLLCQAMAFIYSFDTSTGVCPSLHVAYSMGILSVGLKDKALPRWSKILLTFVVIMICLAVCFVKQHSALDVLAALPVCLLAEYLTFHVFFKEKRAV